MRRIVSDAIVENMLCIHNKSPVKEHQLNNVNCGIVVQYRQAPFTAFFVAEAAMKLVGRRTNVPGACSTLIVVYEIIRLLCSSSSL